VGKLAACLSFDSGLGGANQVLYFWLLSKKVLAARTLYSLIMFKILSLASGLDLRLLPKGPKRSMIGSKSCSLSCLPGKLVCRSVGLVPIDVFISTPIIAVLFFVGKLAARNSDTSLENWSSSQFL
jgi:hypothetical protein